MKNYKDILEEIKENEQKAKALEAEAEILMKEEERTKISIESAGIKDYLEKYHAIKATITPEEEENAIRKYQEAEELRKVNVILTENAKASFAEYAKEIIKTVMKKYTGKQYGEKTKEKIYAEVKQAGVSFYINYNNTFVVSALNDNGYYRDPLRYINIFARKENNAKNGEIINNNNKIVNDFETLENGNHYTEDPAGTIREAKALFEELKKTIEKAKELEAKVNKFIPNKSINATNYIYDFNHYFK